MSKNVIPRAAKGLLIRFNVRTSGHRPGDIVTVTKDDCGWHGGGYFFFVSMLRNADVCEILEVLM